MEKKTLKQHRIEAGFTQNQLAEKTGTTQTSMWRWERSPEALQAASYKTLKKFADALNVPVWSFDFGDDDDKEEGGNAS